MNTDTIHDMLIDYMNEDAAKKILDAIAPTVVYVVTAVDVGDTCDGKARVLGVFKSEVDAKTYVRNDMEDYCDLLGGAADEVDFDEMHVTAGECVCKWSIDEKEVE